MHDRHPVGLDPDLDRALALGRDDLARLDGRHIVMTGGTGFVGSWLLELLAWSADRLGTDPRVTVVTRRPGRFAERRPHLAGHRCVHLVEGDVRREPVVGRPVDLFVAGAAASLAAGDATSEDDLRRTQEGGARTARRFLDRDGCRVLLLSSGAAARDGGAYGAAKRAAEAELLRGVGAQRTSVARLYAFVGPYLPLDQAFAVGNFVGDVLAGRPILVRGDGSPRRTFLYAADLARWLWTVAVRGAPATIYDVGSDEVVTIRELAGRLAALAEPALRVAVEHGSVGSAAGDNYVPSLGPTDQLGLRPAWDLDAALSRTVDWHRRGLKLVDTHR